MMFLDQCSFILLNDNAHVACKIKIAIGYIYLINLTYLDFCADFSTIYIFVPVAVGHLYL